MASSSHADGFPADAEGPAMLPEESELLEALDRLGRAGSDADWHEAVTARNSALRRLLNAVSSYSIDAREAVLTRATQGGVRERSGPTPGIKPTDDGVPRASSE